MKIVESPLFRARKNHLLQEELEELEGTIDKLHANPLIGTPRPEIRKEMYTYLYEDTQGKKILSYRYHETKIQLVSLLSFEISNFRNTVSNGDGLIQHFGD